LPVCERVVHGLRATTTGGHVSRMDHLVMPTNADANAVERARSLVPLSICVLGLAGLALDGTDRTNLMSHHRDSGRDEAASPACLSPEAFWTRLSRTARCTSKLTCRPRAPRISLLITTENPNRGWRLFAGNAAQNDAPGSREAVAAATFGDTGAAAAEGGRLCGCGCRARGWRRGSRPRARTVFVFWRRRRQRRDGYSSSQTFSQTVPSTVISHPLIESLPYG